MAAPTVVGLRQHYASAADAITGVQVIEQIRWIKPAVSQNDLSITNTAGDIIAVASCPTTLEDQVIEMHGYRSNGIIVATLDGGTVDVYIRPN